eukprot:s320_g38.t1
MPALRHLAEAAALENVAVELPRSGAFSRHKISTFLGSELVAESSLRRGRLPLRSEGFSGWFPNPEETRVAPPEGQEAMEVQKAEKAEEPW